MHNATGISTGTLTIHAPATFEIVKEQMHLQENTVFDLDLGVTQNVAEYPVHHVTYAHAQFEVATSSGLGGDASITREFIIMTFDL